MMSVLSTMFATLALAGAAIGSVTVEADKRGATGGTSPSTGSAAPRRAIAADKLLGQRIMVGLPGTSAPGSLLRRVREGRVGSVILFAANIVSRAQLLALTDSLQRAAREGGNPPLLIATDQEGGQVKRLPNGPPHLSPPQIAATGSTAVAGHEGRATGRYLKALGINMDLAPVVDVPTFAGAFIWRQGRAFSFSAAAVARYATPFALGLQAAHVAATAKHFPGLGTAAIDTDNKLDELHPTKAQRDAALVPYRTLIAHGLDAVMVSTGGFPAYDSSGSPAALSRPIIQKLLRGRLGFGGVTITDALGTPTGHDETTAGVLAARAGADILLYTDSAAAELPALERALRTGRLSRSEAQASYDRIVSLKHRVAGR